MKIDAIAIVPIAGEATTKAPATESARGTADVGIGTAIVIEIEVANPIDGIAIESVATKVCGMLDVSWLRTRPLRELRS